MACEGTAPGGPLPRISGRLGSSLDLNITFYKDGIPTDPFAIRKVEIFKSAVQPENLVAEFPILLPNDVDYPSPLSREFDTSSMVKPGIFHLLWDVPATGIPTPDIFFDVWSFIPTDPGVGGGTGITDLETILDDEDLLQKCCNEFWLYPSGFFCDDDLINIRLGFEAIDIKLNKPEIRRIEVGIMPLPLYDFDYNKIAPLIPQLKATFTLRTDNCETLIDNEPMTIGLRQGTFRSNPFTLRYLFDTSRVLKGNYQYQVSLCLPNGETRVSPTFNLQVA